MSCVVNDVRPLKLRLPQGCFPSSTSRLTHGLIAIIASPDDQGKQQDLVKAMLEYLHLVYHPACGKSQQETKSKAFVVPLFVLATDHEPTHNFLLLQ